MRIRNRLIAVAILCFYALLIIWPLATYFGWDIP